jgi:predicted DNA-binding WGR domain protein
MVFAAASQPDWAKTSGRRLRRGVEPHFSGGPTHLPSSEIHGNESVCPHRFISLIGRELRSGDHAGMLSQPYQLYIERTDAARNTARVYAMRIEPDLFGEVCLTRRWGRIGAQGQIKVQHFARERDAVAVLLDLLRQKRSRGYQAIPSTGRH